MNTWVPLALLSAFFAALTAIFTKVDMNGVDSNLAVDILTIVILLLAWAIAIFRDKISGLPLLTRQNRVFLPLSYVVIALSWIFCSRALQVRKVS